MDVNRLFKALETGKRDEVLKVLKENIPDKLYKFVWLDGSPTDDLKFKSLEEQNLWISKITEFNDPFEFKGYFINAAEFRKYGYPEAVIKKYADCFDFSDEYGICCLSNTPIDYLPMWAYYTNTHRGFCIEYEVVKKDFLFEVMYEPKRIPVFSTILQLKDELLKFISGDKTFDSKKAHELGYMFLLNMLIKSDNWAHEKEFRLLYPIDKSKKGENISISTLGLKMTKVIGGYKCLPADLERLDQISKKLNGSGAYKINMSDSEFTTIEELV